MKVLSIGTDRDLFKEESDIRRRVIEYGSLVDELHIVVFATGIKNQELGIKNIKISENTWIYSTDSRNRWFYIFDAVKIGKKILATSHKLLQVPEQSSLLGRQATSWLVTAQDPFESGLAGWFLARRTKIKLQLQIHTDFLSPYFIQHSVFNKIRAMLARFLLPKADCIRVVSGRIKNSLKAKSYKLKAEPIVLPIFVDIEKIRKTPIVVDLHKKYPQFDFIILMASRLTREKNIFLALDAMREIFKKYDRMGLVIVGEGPEQKNLESRIRNYELGDNVIIEEWVDNLISYYKTADLFLLTSNYEGYGRTLVEAAASDCPIVTTGVGIVGEIFENRESALVCEPGDGNCIAEHIREVQENKISKHLLILKAQASLEKIKISKEEYLYKYKQALEQCL